MPYHSMSAGELQSFLSSDPPKTAVVATVRVDGRPHVAPVWYALDEDGCMVFTTGASTVKGRNLRRTGRASACVDDARPPFSFVVLEGPVSIDEDPAALLEWASIIGGRYMGADRAEEFGRRNGVPGELLVRLSPERVVAAADLAE